MFRPVQNGNLPLHIASNKKQADVQVMCALVQANPAAVLTANKGASTPFQLWVARAQNSSLSEHLEISRLLISPDADIAAIKSELSEICGKKFEEFDSANEGVLQPANMVQLALSIKVSLAQLQLVQDQPITRTEFVDACTRYVLDRGTASILLAASKHAFAGLVSLKALGEAYRLVQDQRSKGGETIKVFDSLVDILKQNPANHSMATVKMNAQQITEAEQKAAEQHEDLRRSQRTIQDKVAQIVESMDKKVIQSIDALPEEVKQTIAHRDIMRSCHVQRLRAMQNALLQMAIKASQYVAPSTVIASISDLEDTVLGPMREREELLKSARNTARAGIVLYNSGNNWNVVGAGSEHGPMGARVPLTPAPWDEAIDKALACYDKWVATHLTDAHAKKTDTGMTQLKSALANGNDVAVVLGFKDVPLGTNDLEKAFSSAGSIIAQERAHQLADTFGFFPSSSLMRAAEETLTAWQAESASMQRFVKVYHCLGKDLEMHERCLNDTPGQLYAQKDRVIKELCDAKQMYAKSIRSLKLLTIAIEGGDEDEIEDVTSSVMKRFGLQKMPDKDLQKSLRHKIRSAYNDVTTATQTLAGEIQRHFPEVILIIGNGLPSELGSIWRPIQQMSLDSFDEIQQVVVAGNSARHNLWRARCNHFWFAIKEYDTGQKDGLRTCLKEAAIVYKHRHNTIVEIVALFQGDDGKKFYMQMPWCEHGSLDKWVCSDQQPAWPKVRSVLLDALVGVSHLHVHKILHCDIKPANILVDSRERGRLSDFDISMDTQERTTGHKRTSGEHTTCAVSMRATQDAWTENFAAPELMADRMATKHTDMFAYGKTVQWVHSKGRCEPNAAEQDPHQTRGHTAALVTVLTAREPHNRPSALETIEQIFFTVLHAVNREETRECAFLCSSDRILLKNGIECGCGDFACAECVEARVEYSIRQHQVGSEHKVMCCNDKCTFDDCDLARLLPAAVFVRYLESRRQLFEAQLVGENQAHITQGVHDELARIAATGLRQRTFISHPLVLLFHSLSFALSLTSPCGVLVSCGVLVIIST